MSAICPNGHTSEAEDYCDTCGSPIDLNAQPASAAASEGASGSAAGGSAAGGSAAAGSAAGGSGSGGPGATAGVGPAPAAATSASGAVSTRSSLDLDPIATSPGAAVGAGDADGASAGTTTAPAPTSLECPNCHTENAEGALFCEACGYDFTTGAMPRESAAEASASAALVAASAAAGTEAAAGTGAGTEAAAGTGAAATPGDASGGPDAGEPFDWLAEVWVDPDWYQTQEAEDPCPSPGLPVIMPLRHRSVLLGRVSTSKNTHPEIDLSSDPGVSRRHAQLTTDGTRWFVEDLGSSNGTFVGQASGPLPDEPISVGPKTELGDDDRLYVGAWTRVVVRRATPDEVEAYA